MASQIADHFCDLQASVWMFSSQNHKCRDVSIVMYFNKSLRKMVNNVNIYVAVLTRFIFLIKY
jgi:hypothetical protein